MSGLVWRGLASALVLLLGLSYASDVTNGRFGLGRLIVHPASFDGTEVVLSLVTRRGPAVDGRFSVAKGTDAFTVVGDPLVDDGEELTILGQYQYAERVVVAQAQHAAPGRRAKKWLGGLGLLLVGSLMIASVRLHRDGWGLRG